MANYRAITAVCESIIRLLRMSYRPEDFGNELEFRVCTYEDFAGEMNPGVSLFLYRIIPKGFHCSKGEYMGPDGGSNKKQLILDLHFLLTVWGRDASLQHTVAGWMVSILGGAAILPTGLLDTVAPDVFGQGETVEIVTAELTNEDMLRIWETLTENKYQLSVPYIARNVKIEWIQPVTIGPPVQERIFDYGQPGD